MRKGSHHSEKSKDKCKKANQGKHTSPSTEFKKGYGWKGGRIVNGDGYILIYNPTHPSCTKRGYVYEHRLVVEQQIGRFLLSTEEVHHLGDRDNNGPQKLMAFSNPSAHMKFERYKGCDPHEIIFDGRKFNA